MTDPWVELSPGALARTALHEDPEDCAWGLRQWAGSDRAVSDMVTWFRSLADALEAGHAV